MYALNLDSNNRILSATSEEYATSSMPLVESLPSGNLCNWLYVNGEYVADVLPDPTAVVEETYPVGSLYMTLGDEDPAEQFGGSWIKLNTTGRFILSSSSSYPVSEVTVNETDGVATSYSITNKGGEETHTLTVSEMPSHRHGMKWINYNRGSGSNVAVGQMGDWLTASGTQIANSEYTGSGAAHNNMPPYFTAHVWYRYA